MTYEPRCEFCRFSEQQYTYRPKDMLVCQKSGLVGRASRCDKFEREPGADDEKTGDRDER